MRNIRLLSLIFAGFLAASAGAQALYKNVQKSTDGNNRLIESVAVPTGKTLAVEAGATLSAAAGTTTLTSPILITPALGTPASGVATNLTGTAAGLTAGAVLTNANITLTGDATGSGTGSFAVNVGKINGTALSALATGILKNTTTTGVPSIAVAGDFPTLNQSTTGSAATLTTPRAIYGNNFDGAAALTQIIASAYGGTGNGFTKFTGPLTTEKTYTLPDANATLLYSGGALGTPASGTATNLTGTSGITGTGALNSGSITSGFGAIDVGADSITGGAISGTTLSTTNGLASSFDNASGTYSRWKNNGANTGIIGTANNVYSGGVATDFAIGTETAGVLHFTVNNARVGGFTSTGLNNTVIGATTPAAGSFTTLGAAYSGAGPGLAITNSSDTSGTNFLDFKKALGTTIGSVTRVTTTDAVSYNTTSDGRLKTNIRDFTAADSGRIIDGLRPRWFDWKPSDLTETVEGTVATDFAGADASTLIDSLNQPVTTKRFILRKVIDAARLAEHAANNKSIIGFVAQEEASVDPALVRIGAVTPGDDDPITISRRWARSDAALVPILVAELQSLRARVAALEAKAP